MASATHPYRVPVAGRRWPATVLAVAMHALLVAFLFFGVHWQNKAPDVQEVELYSPEPQIAAPAPVPPPPVVVPPQVVIEPPKPVEVEPPKADIVIKAEPPKKQPPPPKPVVQPPPPPPPEVKPKPASQPSDLARLLGAPSTGTAPQTSGIKGDPGYEGLIKQKVLSNLRFPLPPDLAGNPEAVFDITQLPTGEVDSVTRVQSSGIPGFDAAVERAIQASSPLPKRKDGSVERKITLVFKPLDKR